MFSSSNAVNNVLLNLNCVVFMYVIVFITVCMQLLFYIMARGLQIKTTLLANAGFLKYVFTCV